MLIYAVCNDNRLNNVLYLTDALPECIAIIIHPCVTHSILSVGLSVCLSYVRPVASLLTTGGRLPKILNLLGFENWGSHGCSGETSIFKIILTLMPQVI